MSLLFTIEGLDGTGKSTLAKALHQAILADSSFNKWTYLTKEPGLDISAMANLFFKRPGVDIRSIVLEDRSLSALERELMFYVDASQHRRFIDNQGSAIFISDRGLWSHLAYLRATLKTGQIKYDAYSICNDVIDLVCAEPNKIIYLRGTIELMKARTFGKVKDAIESNKDDFFRYVLETYEDLAFENEDCLILDANNSTSHNVEAVIKFLKEGYTNDQLKSGSQ